MEKSTAYSNKEPGKIMLIINPKSGTMQTVKYLAEILQMYSERNFLTTVIMTQKAGDARIFAGKYGEYYDIVACAGGDGTLNEVIDGIVKSGKECNIGYIPAGSTNDFATTAGLPKGVLDAASVIINGNPHKLDIGNFNGRMFSYVASFGAFTSISYNVPQNLKNIMGHTAYVLQGIKDIVNIKPIPAKVIADEGTPNERICEGKYIFGAVCNSTSIAGIIKFDTFDIDMNDGLMEVLLVKSPVNLSEINEIAKGFLEKNLNNENIDFFSAKDVRFEFDDNVHWTLDGEYEEGVQQINISTLHRAIRLIK